MAGSSHGSNGGLFPIILAGLFTGLLGSFLGTPRFRLEKVLPFTQERGPEGPNFKVWFPFQGLGNYPGPGIGIEDLIGGN